MCQSCRKAKILDERLDALNNICDGRLRLIATSQVALILGISEHDAVRALLIYEGKVRSNG